MDPQSSKKRHEPINEHMHQHDNEPSTSTGESSARAACMHGHEPGTSKRNRGKSAVPQHTTATQCAPPADARICRQMKRSTDIESGCSAGAPHRGSPTDTQPDQTYDDIRQQDQVTRSGDQNRRLDQMTRSGDQIRRLDQATR